MSQKNTGNTDISFEDEYYKEVLGTQDKPLLVDDLKATKKKLTSEAEKLFRLVSKESNSAAVTGDCDTLLEQARKQLNADPPEIAAASRSLDKVKRRLLTAYESRSAWPKWILTLFGVNAAYLFIIGFLIGWYALIPGHKNLESTAFVCLACALWGGLGGVIDAFFAIYYHASNQDFDLHFRTWYFVHPIQGAALGAVVYLLIQAGLMATTGTSLQEATTANITGAASTAVGTSNVGATALPIAIAFLAGFKQNKARRFLTRIVTSIFEQTTKSESEE
jgi:hypothetical protein